MSSKKRLVSLLACFIILHGATSCSSRNNSVLSATESPTVSQPSPGSTPISSAASPAAAPASPAVLSTVGEPDSGTGATYIVATDHLKVRNAPSTSGSILGTLSEGTKLTGSVSNGWLKFTYKGQTGYCNTMYLTTNATAPAGSTPIEAYKDVLTNKQEFFSNPNQVYPGEYNKAKIYLKDFNYFWDYPIQTARFAVLDMDGDQIPEIVLESDDYRSYEVLHYNGGIVCGYNFVYRGMENLRADGTYIASGGADVNYYKKLQFLKDSYTEQSLAHSDMDYDGTVSYFIGENAVSENDFLEYCNKQDTKKDAVWYDYTPQSIEQVFK